MIAGMPANRSFLFPATIRVFFNHPDKADCLDKTVLRANKMDYFASCRMGAREKESEENWNLAFRCGRVLSSGSRCAPRKLWFQAAHCHIEASDFKSQSLSTSSLVNRSRHELKDSQVFQSWNSTISNSISYLRLRGNIPLLMHHIVFAADIEDSGFFNPLRLGMPFRIASHVLMTSRMHLG